jgi:molybdopterin molybdotransferase
VSAGEKDHLAGVLAQFGQTHFWKVKMKPGMPLLFGSLDQARVLACRAIRCPCWRRI